MILKYSIIIFYFVESCDKVIMILLLMFVACAFGTEVLESRPPAYNKAKYFLDQAMETIEAHVLSMEDGIPDLTDHRRHYAIIFHVAYTEAITQVGCLVRPFDVYYQRNINESAPEALCDPQIVVDETRAFVDTFNEKTGLIQDLIKKYCTQPGQRYDCDEEIQRQVSYYLSPSKDGADALIAGGAFAEAFLKKHAEFAAMAYDLKALEYVIGATSALQDIVEKFALLLRNLMGELTC